MEPPRHTRTYHSDDERTPDGPRAAPLEVGERVGHFQIVSRIGSGGMGDVYAARDTTLDRKVALKVLRLAELPTQDRYGRFLREAQALGRIVHPNVVTVFEAGDLGGRLFLAMELVEGGTLRGWLAEPRPWREVVARFAAAGRGLIAVHDHGLVHRDFKPENVLLGAGGRVCVSDFGVVGLAGTPVPGAAATPESMVLDLTQTGMRVGTPLYMAPEQHEGGTLDARTDQFAFAASLYRALYGAPPFAGTTLAELRENVLAGRVRPPPRGRGVPRWLEPIVMRGLLRDPGARHPSMTAFVAALERGPRITWGRVAAVLGPVAVVVTLWGMWPARGDPCRGVDEGLAMVWGPDAHAALSSAFAGSGRPYAADSARRATAILDGYGAGWATARVEACRATAVRGEQTAELRDARLACLDRRLDGLRALTRLLVAADAEIVDRAVPAALALDPVDGCGADRLLGARAPAARPPQGAALLERLDEAAAQIRAGKAKVVLTRLPDAIAEARRLGDASLLAQALLLYGRAAIDKEPASAVAPLEEAVKLSGELADDDLTARTLLELLRVIGIAQGKHSDALALRPAVEAAVGRSRDPRHRIVLLQTTGSLLFDLGQYPAAIANYDEELALIDRTVGRETLEMARALRDRGKVLAALERNDEAVAAGKQALAIAETILGPDHLDIAVFAGTLGIQEWKHRHFAEAEAQFRRMLKISEEALGPESIRNASALANLGTVANDQGKFGEALPYFQRALAIQEKLTGGENAQVATMLNNLAFSLSSLGKLDEALATQRRALAIREKVLPPTHPDTAASLVDIGGILREQGHAREGLGWIERALAIDEKVLPPGHPSTVMAAALLAETLAELGEGARAVAAAARAQGMLGASPEPVVRAHVELATAWALRAAHREPERARELARSACATLAAEPAEQRTVTRARRAFGG